MSSFKLHMRDGQTIDIPHEGRHGGSYTKTIDYKPGFIVITDEYGRRTSYPADDIFKIDEVPTRW